MQYDNAYTSIHLSIHPSIQLSILSLSYLILPFQFSQFSPIPTPTPRILNLEYSLLLRKILFPFPFPNISLLPAYGGTVLVSRIPRPEMPQVSRLYLPTLRYLLGGEKAVKCGDFFFFLSYFLLFFSYFFFSEGGLGF